MSPSLPRPCDRLYSMQNRAKYEICGGSYYGLNQTALRPSYYRPRWLLTAASDAMSLDRIGNVPDACEYSIYRLACFSSSAMFKTSRTYINQCGFG